MRLSSSGSFQFSYAVLYIQGESFRFTRLLIASNANASPRDTVYSLVAAMIFSKLYVIQKYTGRQHSYTLARVQPVYSAVYMLSKQRGSMQSCWEATQESGTAVNHREERIESIRESSARRACNFLSLVHARGG